eukprot:GEMP01007551.1.p1 GENE.GEMP01007551.1~~GEMP01007551.1.p1  ORF type:complete len:551 (+),score=91.96 GEMP01007551.1:426-2078(+)
MIGPRMSYHEQRSPDRLEPPERKFEASMDTADHRRRLVNLRKRQSVRNPVLGMNKGLEITRSYLQDVVQCGGCKSALCRTNDLVHDEKAVDIAMDDSPDDVICLPSGRAHLRELGKPFLLHSPGSARNEANWSYLVRNVGCGACRLFLGFEVIRTVSSSELTHVTDGFPMLTIEGIWLLTTSHRPLISALKTRWVDARNEQQRKYQPEQSSAEQFPSCVSTASTACPSDLPDFTSFSSSFTPFRSSASLSASLDVPPRDASSSSMSLDISSSSSHTLISTMPTSANDASRLTPRADADAGVEEPGGAAGQHHITRGGRRDSLLKSVLVLSRRLTGFSYREEDAERRVERGSGQQPSALSSGEYEFGVPPFSEVSLVGKWWWQNWWRRLTLSCPCRRRQVLHDQRRPPLMTDGAQQNSIPIAQVYLGFRFLDMLSTMGKPAHRGAPIYCGNPSCNAIFSNTNQILDVKRRWAIGEARPERAMFMNSLVMKNIDVRNPRRHRLAQGCFDMADVFCLKCQLQIGYAFISDKSEENRNVNQVGRYGLVCSAVRL